MKSLRRLVASALALSLICGSGVSFAQMSKAPTKRSKVKVIYKSVTKVRFRQGVVGVKLSGPGGRTFVARPTKRFKSMLLVRKHFNREMMQRAKTF